MKVITFLRAYFSSPVTVPVRPATSKFECPNCWGTQEWENEERPAVHDLSKDTTLIGRARQGFIQRFANKYLTRRRRA